MAHGGSRYKTILSCVLPVLLSGAGVWIAHGRSVWLCVGGAFLGLIAGAALLRLGKLWRQSLKGDAPAVARFGMGSSDLLVSGTLADLSALAADVEDVVGKITGPAEQPQRRVGNRDSSILERVAAFIETEAVRGVMEPEDKRRLESLGRLDPVATSSVIDVVTKTLRATEFWWQFYRCTEVLMHLGPHASGAVTALASSTWLSHEQWTFRERALQTLAAIGPAAASAREEVSRGVQDADEHVRQAAAVALKTLAAAAPPKDNLPNPRPPPCTGIFLFDYTKMPSSYGEHAFRFVVDALADAKGESVFHDGDVPWNDIRRLLVSARTKTPVSSAIRASPLSDAPSTFGGGIYAIAMWTDQPGNLECLHRALDRPETDGYLGWFSLDAPEDRVGWVQGVTDRLFLPACILINNGQTSGNDKYRVGLRGKDAAPAWAKVSKQQIEAAKRLGIPVAFENPIGMRFVLIPPGKFTMGSPENEVRERSEDEVQHDVEITKAYYLAIFETTNAQYKRFDPEHKGRWDDADQPVETVSHDDASEFVAWLNAQDRSHKYRLPTEAEWEYACRAGTKTPFPFGDTIRTDQANYDGNYTYGRGRGFFDPPLHQFLGVYRQKAMAVGSFAPNGWGLFDMHGNLWEWCADWYDAGYYAKSPRQDPSGPPSGSARVCRGGSWNDFPWCLRSASHYSCDPGLSSAFVGFRVVAVSCGTE